MHLLIPDLLLPREHVAEMLAGLELPGLTGLLSHAKEIERETALPAFQRSLPATRWLLQAFGLPASVEHAGLAAALRSADDLPGDGIWHLALPCHFAVARDHVQLGIDRIDLPLEQAQALFDAVRPLFEEDGIAFEPGRDGRWYLHHVMFDALLCAEPSRAIGRNVDLWLPDVAAGADPTPARRWRRLHNEIQMLWYEHPVNQAREARGEPPINGLWLFGGAARQPCGPAQVNGAFTAVAARADQAFVRGLAQQAGKTIVAPDPATSALVVLDELSAAAAHDDWASWRDALVDLERRWFAPLARHAAPVTLTVCSEHHWSTRQSRRAKHWQFWRRATLTRALAA